MTQQNEFMLSIEGKPNNIGNTKVNHGAWCICDGVQNALGHKSIL